MRLVGCFAGIIFSMTLWAAEYPPGSVVKLAAEVDAFSPEDITIKRGRLPVGGLLKISKSMGDDHLVAMYKSMKAKKLIPVVVKISDLEGSAVKGQPSKKRSRTPRTTTPTKVPDVMKVRPSSATQRELMRTKGVDFSVLNTALGKQLFVDKMLWDEPAEEIATRLNWPKESETETQSSYRLYAKEDYSIFGARPFSLALYAEKKYPTFFSMIFANKGDAALLESGLAITMKEDAASIETRMTEALGKPRVEIYGQGKLKERVQRWDWENHAILLASPRDEYVGVRIMPSGMADAEGKGAKVRDAEMKALLGARVVKRDNGDTLVSQIPMVDQGPKGYCVPATWERYLRYMEIPADMYMLAMVGGTGVGGGTSIRAMIESTKSMVMRYGRKLTDIDTEFTVKNIAKQIDRGIPIIWMMNSGDKYNATVNAYTKERRSSGWEDWRANLDSRRASMRNDVNDSGGHVCMISGYNKETNEFAVSDSWGKGFEERWIPAEAALAASQYYMSFDIPVLYIIRW